MMRTYFLTTAFLTIAVLLLLCASSQAQTITRGPYLQRTSPESTIIRWTTDVAADSTVTVGAAAGQELRRFSVAGTRTRHRVELTDLAPDTRYFYKVVSSGTTLAGGDSTHSFVTFPTAGDEPFNVWALGDAGTSGTLSSGENPSQAAVRDAFLSIVPTPKLAFLLLLGDNAYSTGTDIQYQRALFNIYPTALRTLSTWSTQGNHDVTANAYYDIFSFPRNAQSGGVASGTEQYFSFNYANAHFIILNSEISGATFRTAMLEWLQQDLTANSKSWTIVAFHHPPYTKGSHDSDNISDSGGRMAWVRENVLPIIEAAGVDLVLTGHSHGYERSFLLNGHYDVSTTFNPTFQKSDASGKDDIGEAYEKSSLTPQGNSGTVYVVAGSSGKVSAGVPLNHPAMYTSLAVLGSLHLSFNANELLVRMIDSAGEVRDHFMVRKAPARPRVVTTLSTNASAASCSLSLSWSPSQGAASYAVYRSELEYRQGARIAMNVTDTAFSDSSAKPGKTYYYSVRGVNSSGSGPWSENAAGVIPTTDSDGDDTIDCADGCPDHAGFTSPGPCGCGKAPYGTFANARANCSAPLSRSRTPSTPVVARTSTGIRITMDSYAAAVEQYSVTIQHQGKVIRRFTTRRPTKRLSRLPKGLLYVRYAITFNNGNGQQVTRRSARRGVRIS